MRIFGFGKKPMLEAKKPTPRNLHPRLAQLVSEGWMDIAGAKDGRPLIIDGVTYYEYIRNAEKLTYSRNLAYEAAVSEYNEIAGHSALLRSHIDLTEKLASEIFNYRNTDPPRAELAMQHLIGISASTKKALETKHPIGFICQVAAIFYVAENEDPDINDMTLQEEKAAIFLRAKEYHDFFFKMPCLPLNVLGTLLDLNSPLSTTQAYHNVAEIMKLMYLSTEYDSTDEEQKNIYRRLVETCINTIHSYEHLFMRLTSSSTT